MITIVKVFPINMIKDIKDEGHIMATERPYFILGVSKRSDNVGNTLIFYSKENLIISIVLLEFK